MTKTITGKWVTPNNAQTAAVVAGSLTLKLTLSGVATAGVSNGQVTPVSVVSIPLVNNAIPAATTIWANDELTPTNTTYSCIIVDTSNNNVWSAKMNISGASPIDLNVLTPS